MESIHSADPEAGADGTGELPFTLEDLRRAVAALAGVAASSVGDDDDLISMGMDSIGVMRLAGALRGKGIEIKYAELFERRTLAEWSALVSSRQRATASSAVNEATTVDEAAPFDLALMQHAYWIGRGEGQPLGTGCHVYLEFDGRGVEPRRLEHAVRMLVRRHGMLRARFLDDGRQQIMAEGAWPGLRVRDLSCLPEEEVVRELTTVRTRESNRRLDVHRGETFDVQLSLLAGGRTRLHFNIDMMAADALSFRIMLHDMARLYARPEDALPPIRYSYPRYRGARARRRRDAYERARSYWKACLGELPGPPQLPLAADPTRIDEPRVTRRERWLPPTEQRVIAQRARDYGLTLSMVFATAFAEVLAAWSAEPRFVLNLPLFDREVVHPDVALLVGDFTSSLLLAVDASVERSFVGRARQLQARFQADVAHAEYSGLEVLRDRARDRGGEAAMAPIVFTSALSMGELFDDEVQRRFGGLSWMISQTSQVWLDHQVTELDGGLLVNWDSVEQLFPAGMLDAMFEAYVGLLQWACAPEADWDARIPSLLPSSQAAARSLANATAGPESGRPLHEGFFAQAARRPDRTALTWGDCSSMSYGELAARARRIAGLLAVRGLAPGEKVAVVLPKGPGQIEAILGVLHAGGVYVPIGLDQPAQRRGRILASAGMRFVLTGAASRSSLDWPDSLELLAIEDAARATEMASPAATSAGSPAYVIFTSGSTGEPKGVVVSHRAAMNTINAINDRLCVTEDDRALAISALDFDLSVYDVFGLLSVGGAVVLIEEDDRRDAHRWVDLVRRWGVTLWQSAPALLDMLLTAAAVESLGSSLRLALVGGDWVGLDLADRLVAGAPGCRLVALGGTTETAIHSTFMEITEVAPHWRSIPFGVPLRNVRCRVVDPRGRDRPDWVPGELWIGGASVAEGYLGDPDRTARRFVDYDGARWYRTGDLARYWPDGTLEFLGRVDNQVKIRGHRVELGEVEAALAAHARVAHAVAITIGDRAPRLVAAAVPKDRALDVDELLSFVAERLPAYMVPERVAVLERLPLTANGKVDREEVRRLLAHDGAARRELSMPPRGEVEEAVAAVWAELLGVLEVTREQSFFKLGGDSLLATRMVTRLRAAGVEGAHVRRIFAAPALKDFAAALRLGATTSPTPPLAGDAARRHEPFPLTEVQRAYWLGRSDGFTLGGVGSYWYWEFDGAGVDLARLEEAFNRLIARHEMMRAVVNDDGLQRVLPEVPRFEIPATEAAAGKEHRSLDELRAAMSHKVLDTSRWPLFDVRALRYGGDRTRIGFGFDYIVLDALSITTVFWELSRLYADLDAALPSVDVSFRDYVLGVRADPETLASAKDHWTRRVADLPPPPELPLAKDPSRILKPRFTRREACVPAATWRAITERARRHDLTASTVVAKAFADVLSAWSSRPDLTLNFTLFDRREVHPDIHNILGDFTSLLLVPYRPSPSDGWLANARHLQEEVWLGLEHREVSAVWVLRELWRKTGASNVAMPVVFTSTLGVADDRINLSMPFGAYAGGLSQTPQVWLDSQIVEHEGALLVNWDAVEELFPAGLLDAMFEAYTQQLGWLAAPETDWTGPAPDCLPADQRRIRADVNATIAPESERLLHEGFFAHAAQRPDRTALAWGGDGRLSYGELAARALRVGSFLRSKGVQPGDPVAVSLPRGPDQIAAVLGVLAVGAAFVPVGVDQPPLRRQRIYASAGVRAVLTDLTDACGAAPLRAPAAQPRGSLAYVIYTSGSTGEPKGVEITHRAAINTVEDINARYGIGEEDRVLSVSALDFDLSVYDIFGLLSAGGAVVLIGEEDRREAQRWVDLIRRWGVTVWNSVPALLDMLLVEAADRGLGASLRLVLVSGDWVGLDLPGRLAAQVAGCRLVALGGATEASIWSNAFEVTEVSEGWRSIPYGRPLRNQKYRAVDAWGRDCPDWVPGELWIGGAGVALRYRGDPEETARRFVERDGERWYRTGDLGRYWPDGTLELLGRTDRQVKIRGHRIELGEIEAALQAHPRVARAAAVVSVGGRAPRLVGFAVPVDPALAPDDLRAFVVERLPSHMVPDRVLTLDHLPLSANGKVDRNALARVAGGEAIEADHQRPEGPIEGIVGRMWMELLGVPEIGRHQSFFALGGDSLLATRLVGTLRRRFGIELALRQLFEASTIAELAAMIAERRRHLETGDMEEGVL